MVKNYDDMLSRFHLIPERNGQTDGHTDLRAIKTMLTHRIDCFFFRNESIRIADRAALIRRRLS